MISSLALLGLNIHAAGFFDPGFEGQATLEVSTFTDVPIKIYSETRICQMVFVKTSEPTTVSYSEKGKYQNQIGPTLSKSYEDKN